MCTESNHVESAKAPVAANTQPTTAVVAAKPQKRVYSWEYWSPNKLNLIKSNDASSELDLSAGLNANQVAYYFDANNVPTHKRIVNLATEKVEPDDIIFQQDFMKTQKTTVSPYSVVVYDNGDLTKPIRSTDFDNEKDAKRILGKLIKPNEVTYMYAGGVPVKKRFRGEDSVQIVANDPIWNKPVPVATTTSKLEARFYNKIDLKVPTKTSIVNKLEDYDYPGYGVNGINSGQVVYIFENDKPIKKRGYFESFVDVPSTDPIWGTLQIKPEPKAQIEIRVYSQNDLNKVVLSKIVESFDDLEWLKTPMDGNKIAYAFVDGKPVKSRKGNMTTEDVLSLDPIWETLKPKVVPQQMVAKKQFKVVSYKSNTSINTVTKEAEFDNMSDALYALKQFDMGYGREEMRYLFKDGIAIKKRLIDQDPDDVTAIDVFFPNGVLVVQVKEPAVTPATPVTPAVDTEKPTTLQEFLKELMKAHEHKKYTYFDNGIFRALLQKFWPEKAEYYNDNKSMLTSTYRMFDIMNSWNPPAKKKNKKYKFKIHKLRHDFIIEAARLVNTSNPSDKLVESIESFGRAVSMFVGDWKNDIRVVLAKHFNNPLWLKNGVFTVNNESYELEQIDMVIT